MSYIVHAIARDFYLLANGLVPEYWFPLLIVSLPFFFGLTKILVVYYHETNARLRKEWFFAWTAYFVIMLFFLVSLIYLPLTSYKPDSPRPNIYHVAFERMKGCGFVFVVLDIMIFLECIRQLALRVYRRFIVVPSHLKIHVRLSNGSTGWIDPNDFDSSTMSKL